MWILYSVSSLCLCRPSHAPLPFVFSSSFEMCLKSPPVTKTNLHGPQWYLESILELLIHYWYISFALYHPFISFPSVQIFSILVFLLLVPRWCQLRGLFPRIAARRSQPLLISTLVLVSRHVFFFFSESSWCKANTFPKGAKKLQILIQLPTSFWE